MNYGMIILGVIRGLIVWLTLDYFGRYIDKNPPKNEFVHRLWVKDTKLRRFGIKYAWQIGLAVFLLHFLFV